MNNLKLKKLKPVYYYYWSNCNEEDNIKNAKWCAKCSWLFCSFPVTRMHLTPDKEDNTWTRKQVPATGLSLTQIGSINIVLVSTLKQSNGISLAMTVLLYLIGTSVGPVIAGIFMQMYQTTIEGIVGSFPASQSYNSIFITSILMSMVSIVLFTVINKRTSKAIDGSIINTP
jgi:hypothetical protein